jgi:membrane-associated phospholipid phosphatase
MPVILLTLGSSTPQDVDVAHRSSMAALNQDTTQATDQRPARPRVRRRIVVVWISLALGFLLVSLADRSFYRFTCAWDLQVDSGLNHALRAMGYWPFWAAVSVVLLLIDRRRMAGQRIRAITERAELLLWTTLLAGITANVLKVLLRRERPINHDGEYVFRGFDDRFLDAGGLGLPSGDVSIAAAAAFVLLRMTPEARFIWLLVIAGSAFSRLVNGAHFLSDVYVAILIGMSCEWIVWRFHVRNKLLDLTKSKSRDAN